MGRCATAIETKEAYFNMVGRIPSYMRASISDFIQHWGTRNIGNDGHGVNIGGQFQGTDPVELFSRTVAQNLKDLAAWKYAVGNDTCVADNDSVYDLNNGNYQTSAIRGVIIAAYQSIIGTFPVNTSCMANQLLFIKSFAPERFPKKIAPTLVHDQ
jgi:hypothetical protein